MTGRSRPNAGAPQGEPARSALPSEAPHPPYRGLRPRRRPPDRRARRHERFRRLALSAPLRLGRLFRRAARRREQRALADRPGGRRPVRPPLLPARHPRPRHRVGDRRGRGTRHRPDATARPRPRSRTDRRGRTRRGDRTQHAAAAVRLRGGRAVDAPGERAPGGRRRAGLGVAAHRRGGAHLGPGLHHVLGVHRRRGRAGRVRADLASLARAASAVRRPVRGAGHGRRGLAGRGRPAARTTARTGTPSYAR